MKRAVRKSRLAESDLVGIWQYSLEEWDGAQADRYLDELDNAIRLLTEHPELGVNRDFVRKGYRVLICAAIRAKNGDLLASKTDPLAVSWIIEGIAL